ncbi:hypothetical protein Bra1253DRAFT_07763 [Bradyrhizobium sp. WSM1253]|nr:hypothetical protein Bra1253DRAFT_07763 [Bradyrhizobium sp. WSM1253]
MTFIGSRMLRFEPAERPRSAAISLLVRYRAFVFLLAGAIVVAGLALQWHWTTSLGLLRILAFLPCILMMFRCMNCGMRWNENRNASSSDSASGPRSP